MKSLNTLLRNTSVDRLDNRVLLREITGFSDAYLISRGDYILTGKQYQQYCDALARLIEGEPVAYILGYKEFYSRRFKVNSATLIPRPETELLVDKVLELAPIGANLLDMGTGSGCIAISCKLEREDLDVTAIDSSDGALAVAIDNANQLMVKINIIKSNWYQNITGKFAIIASNPPYIQSDDEHLHALQYEPRQALTDFADGLECIREIIKGAPQRLDNGGLLIMEHGYDQAGAVRELLLSAGFEKIITIRDYAGIERISYGYLK